MQNGYPRDKINNLSWSEGSYGNNMTVELCQRVLQKFPYCINDKNSCRINISVERWKGTYGTTSMVFETEKKHVIIKVKSGTYDFWIMVSKLFNIRLLTMKRMKSAKTSSLQNSHIECLHQRMTGGAFLLLIENYYFAFLFVGTFCFMPRC